MSTMIQRSKATNEFIKGGTEGGTCFTISPRRLEDALRRGILTDVFPNWKLGPSQQIEKLGFGLSGLTVFIGDKAPPKTKLFNVKLNNRIVGAIYGDAPPDKDGQFQYRPKGSKLAGDIFPTITKCVKSLGNGVDIVRV